MFRHCERSEATQLERGVTTREFAQPLGRRVAKLLAMTRGYSGTMPALRGFGP